MNYILGEVSGGDKAAIGVNGIQFHEAGCQVANHVCGIVEVTGLFLVEFGQGRESIWETCIFNDGLEGLCCCGVGLEEGYFGVAEALLVVCSYCSSR
jgi:hypothetical protein